MSASFLTIVVAAVLTSFAHSIPVTIYYESLCSDSVEFITNQLYPNYKDLKEYMELDFIPYGKAMHSFNNKTRKYEFKCQHGRTECKGNKFQACGLEQIKDQDSKVDFVNCVMNSTDPSGIYYVEICSKQLHLDFQKLTICVASSQADELLAAFGDRTWSLEPNLYHVPTVILNNSLYINPVNMRQATREFKKLICDQIPDLKPKACQSVGMMRRIRNAFSSVLFSK